MSSLCDLVSSCLDFIPVPGLHASFTILRFIWDTVQSLQAMKQQMTALTASGAQLLQILNSQYASGRLLEANTSWELRKLHKLLTDVSEFASIQASYGIFKMIYRHNETISTINHFHRSIDVTIKTFNITSLINIQDWQARNALARIQDQDALETRLTSLEANQKQLADMINSQHTSVMAMMVSLQKSLEKDLVVNARQRQFLSHSLNYLASTSSELVQVHEWTITVFEVEFGQQIGSGGFGQVYKGTWNRTTVALKVLRDSPTIVPSASTIRREVETWSKLRHPHILQFFGANIFDDKPFIVMPYVKNGNARDYVLQHPSCDRFKILYHVSLGLVYLHSQNVIHGDLKGLNILIDDAGNALLCDFGLSRVKADASSRSVSPSKATSVAGSRNWMAPERLLGGSLRKPVDIYAFGMTVYEIFTSEVPLGHLTYEGFINLVARQDVRPERPDVEDCLELTDEMWALAERCWVKEPKSRPDAVAVCDEMQGLVNNTSRPRLKAKETHVEEHKALPVPPVFPVRISIPFEPTEEALHQRQHQRPIDVDNESSRTMSDRALPPLPTTKSAPVHQTYLTAPPTTHYHPHSTSNTTSADYRESDPLRLAPLRRHFEPDYAKSSMDRALEVMLQEEQQQEQRPLQERDTSDHRTWAQSGVTAVNSKTYSTPLPKNFNSKAKVLYNFYASSVDPNELSITKGDIIDIVKTEEEWWIARRSDGKEGIIPRNYVKVVNSDYYPPVKTEKDTTHSSGFKFINRFLPNRNPSTNKQGGIEPISKGLNRRNDTSTTSSTGEENMHFVPLVTRVRARHSYQASSTDTTELSFIKGEELDILDAKENWWIARKGDMSEGIVPSNYMQIIE